MSLIGQKVLIVIPLIKKDGSMDEKKNIEYSAIVLDKFLNGYPNPNNPQMNIQCDNYLVLKPEGDTETIHPSFVVKVLD
jgi:hypothetical protein